MRERLKFVLVTAIFASAIIAVIMYARNYYFESANRSTLSEVMGNTLSRVERSLDRNIVQIGELYADGAVKCGAGAESVLDSLVLKAPSIKYVVFEAENTICKSSSYFSLLSTQDGLAQTNISAQNKNISFGVTKKNDLSGLVMKWQLDDQTSVSSFLNLDDVVFDVLPAAVSDTSNLEIVLSDGTMLGALRDDAKGMHFDINMRADSNRYPIYVSLGMPQATMDNWISPLPLPAILSGLLAILMISILVARGILTGDSGSQAIRRALRNGSIFPYYQPVYCIKSGELIGFEVLARRKDKNGQMLSPATFIPTIEKNNWGDLLLEVLMKDAAKTMDSIFDAAQTTTLAFNVTPKQLGRDGFVQWFTELLAKTHIPPEAIILEVTEREVVNDLENLQRNISALRDLDITIAIDDVGTGHNGLSSIHQLRADYLKIDKLFVDGVVMDEHAGALVKMLIDVGAQYGMQIIAEGVETAEQLEALRKLGVDEVQGFYMAKPMPALEAISELAHHRTVRTRVMLQKGLEVKQAHGSIKAAAAS